MQYKAKQHCYAKMTIYFAIKIVVYFFLHTTLFASDTLTMEDAIVLGMKNNFDIIITRNETEKATNNLILGTGYLLPQVNASTSANRSWTYDLQNNTNSSIPNGIPGQPGGDSKTLSATVGINANWTFFDGFRMFSGRKLLYVYADLGKEQQQLEIENTALQIIRVYCNATMQQQLVTIANEQVKVSKQRLEREQSRNEIGRSKKREILNAEVILNNDQSNLEQQKLILRQTRNTLNVLIGRNPKDDATVSSRIVLPPLRYTLVEIEKKTLERNTTLKQLELRLHSSELNLKIKKAALSPMLVASGSYNYSYDRMNNETKSKKSIPSLGLSLQWNLLNGFSKEIGIKNAKLDLKKSHLEKEKYELQLRALIQQKWDNLEYSYRQVEFEQNALELARQNAEISNEMYAFGKLTGLAFREAQLAYQNAAMRYQNSIVTARISLAELEQLAGEMRVE